MSKHKKNHNDVLRTGKHAFVVVKKRQSESTANTGLRQQLDSALKRGDAAELELQSLRQQFAGAPTAAQMEALLKERDSLRSRLNSLSKPPSEPESVSAPEEPVP